MCLCQLGTPYDRLLPLFHAVRLQRYGVDRLRVAPRCLSLLRLLEWKLAEPTGEARRAQAVLSRAAYSSIHTRQGTHNDPEALSDERVGRLAVLGDQRGVVALLAGILTLSLQADPLADERRDDHLEALPCGGALRAPRQPVDAQPDDKQMGDQRGHPGILHCPPQRPGDMKSHAEGLQLQLRGALLCYPRLMFLDVFMRRRKKKKKRVLPLLFSPSEEKKKSLLSRTRKIRLRNRHV